MCRELSPLLLTPIIFAAIFDIQVVYSVHLPTNGEYFLQIFASKTDAPKPGEVASMDGVKLKCVCKFKIVCNNMDDNMFPLPNCAPGEWGPRKANRQYMMNPVTHTKGIITADNNLKVKFSLGMPLVFLAKLKMNDINDNFFQDFVDAQYDDEHLRVKLGFPAEGQYGLDIYAKPKSAPANQPLAHACKYLINVTSVQNPIGFGLSSIENAVEQCMGCWGEQPAMEKYSIIPLTHKSWKIRLDKPTVVVKFQVPTHVTVSAHLVREPDDDYGDHLVVRREGDQTVSLSAQALKSDANYMLTVFGRQDRDDSTVFNNVFNYLIRGHLESDKS